LFKKSQTPAKQYLIMSLNSTIPFQVVHIADLGGHEGPVFEVAWSHPKFGSLLASCGYDNRVIIWKEVSENVWQQIYQSTMHTASVNSLAWAPYELGLSLAAASSDGTLSVLTYQPDGTWTPELIENAHPVGANSISWSPAAPKGSLVGSKAPGMPVKRIVSGGSDNTVKVWTYDDPNRRWHLDGNPLTGHADWVRDVAWAPNLGLPMNTIASAGQDGRLLAWTEREDGSAWDPVVVHDFNGAPVWRVSWSTSGNVLAATDGSGAVTLWSEVTDGRWQQVSE
jgi:protein transport protein SEC13